MPRSRDTLQRFRPAGTPGAASAAGIPVDRVAEASAELEPVLSLLADTQAEVAGLRRAAEREAEQRRQAAVTRATALIAAAHRQATAERAAAALRVSTRVQRESAAAMADAERDAEAVRRAAAERMPAFVDRVLAGIRTAMRDGREAHP